MSTSLFVTEAKGDIESAPIAAIAGYYLTVGGILVPYPALAYDDGAGHAIPAFTLVTPTGAPASSGGSSGIASTVTLDGTPATAYTPDAGATGDMGILSSIADRVATTNTKLNSPAQDGTVAAITAKLPTNPALDGTDATGVTAPSGAVGIRGWLSGIYKAVTGTLAISGNVMVTDSVALSTTDTNGGTSATGVTFPTGATGILGWLSGIYKLLSGSLTISGNVVVTDAVALSTTDTNGGSSATAVAQPTGGAGILGWLSGIYSRLGGTLTIAGNVVVTDATALSTTDSNGGTSATGVAFPTGGTGFLGWLSGIYKLLSGTIATSVSNFPPTQPISGSVSIAANIASVGAGKFAPIQLTLTTVAAVVVAAARTGASGVGRVSISITNLSNVTIYLGDTSAVTSANGYPLLAGSSVLLQTTDAIYGCLAAAGSALIASYELY